MVLSSDEVICLWRLSPEVASGGNLVGEEFLANKENWTVARMLRWGQIFAHGCFFFFQNDTVGD